VVLRDLLSVPYLLQAEATESEPGQWRIRLEYPELPGCSAEGTVVEDALRELERRRIEIIVGMVEQGKRPPVPRAPLEASDPLWAARELGLEARVATLLNTPSKP
jgi:predicted RNase H-like HicB family nuclease